MDMALPPPMSKGEGVLKIEGGGPRPPLISYSKKFVVYDVYSPFTYGSMANRLVNMMRTSEFDETG